MSCLKVFYLIKSADLRQTRAGKNYLAFTFQDDSGEIEWKLWDAHPHNVEAFTAGKVVHMQGREKFIIILLKSIKSRLFTSAWGTQWSSWLQVKSPVDVKEIRDYMSQMIFKIENPVGSVSFGSLYTKYDKNSTLIQLPRPTTMPLRRVWPIIQQPWCVWRCH